MDVVLFLLLSTLETLAIYALTMSLLKLKASRYAGQAVVVMLLSSLQSYLLRNSLELDYLAPMTTVVIFVFFYAAVVKIPVIWSLIGTVLSYFGYAIMQGLLIMAIFGSIEAAQLPENAYLTQILSAAAGFLLAWLLHRFKIGIALELERLRLKYEYVILMVLMAIVLLLLAILFYMAQLWLLILFFSLTFGIFLYYAYHSEEFEVDED
ncbi:hypothetical protein E6C60_1001 [Paenibacillus algicola]|uniref:Uncharacterized protein n=1 Tax=Paenibacillus algicola TaxID=2565926 RepID=A0A4P8XN36_9BACL|nr:hypothetical protein [Paenibacillus algicola]QCT01719.1 hypothetical protein E6C60_1001 [Paenibacillus algicola]